MVILIESQTKVSFMAAYILFMDIVCLNGAFQSSEYVTMVLYQHIVHMPVVRACDQ